MNKNGLQEHSLWVKGILYNIHSLLKYDFFEIDENSMILIHWIKLKSENRCFFYSTALGLFQKETGEHIWDRDREIVTHFHKRIVSSSWYCLTGGKWHFASNTDRYSDSEDLEVYSEKPFLKTSEVIDIHTVTNIPFWRRLPSSRRLIGWPSI